MSKPVICIGASFVDELCHLTETLLPATTNKSTVTRSAGGVARNVAHQLALLEVPVHLISVFGNDPDGDWLKKRCHTAGIRLDSSITIDAPSGKYTAILHPDGSLHAAFLSHPLNDFLTIAHLSQVKSLLLSAAMLVVDTNVMQEVMHWLIIFSREAEIPLMVDPVSVPPAKMLGDLDLRGITLLTPNEDELPALCMNSNSDNEKELIKELQSRGVKQVWLHKGEQGSSFFSKEESFSLPASSVNVVDSTGAGDAALAGYILGQMLGKTKKESVLLGHLLAAEVLQVKGAMAPGLGRNKLLSLSNQYIHEQLFNHPARDRTGPE